jgi:hypothetical protein
MSLLGLHRYEATGGVSPIEIGTALGSLFRDYSWVDNIGDAGLLLWLAALAAPERLSGLCSGLRVESALARFQGAREGRTMELAWFLAGLSHAALAKSERLPKLEGLAMATFESLKRNQGRHGIFGHQAAGRSVGGVLRGRIGSFADQVYPIYALTRFAQAYEVSAALAMAQRCADAICHAQGELGQWWWHYDGSSGRVFQKYPVYSVHQHGMAPMALLALAEATGSDYSGPVHRGLAWIDKNNELGLDLRDTPSNLIWRCIYRTGWTMYLREFANFLRPAESAGAGSDLKVLCECRPYELGWLLYALAGRDGN